MWKPLCVFDRLSPIGSGHVSPAHFTPTRGLVRKANVGGCQFELAKVDHCKAIDL